MIEIKHRHTGQVLYTHPGNTLSGADLRGADLRRAILHRADLRGADLREADLRGADLERAILHRAILEGAILEGADLRGADLHGADLRVAFLYGANLREAILRGADLREAILTGADLRRADLRGAILEGAKLPDFQIVPETGSFTAWKKLKDCVVAELLIPKTAKRTSSLVGRKCRASEATVVALHGTTKKSGVSDRHGVYTIGETYTPDSYDDDIRDDCTHGVHFFMTRKEAEEY